MGFVEVCDKSKARVLLTLDAFVLTDEKEPPLDVVAVERFICS